MNPTLELALRRQFDEAKRQALEDPAKAIIARIALQSIIDGTSEVAVRAKVGQKTHKPNVDLVEERRVHIEANFLLRGFEISVPRPNVSNTTLKRWRREGRELFYRPATALVSYETWMTAHGQANHWTVVSEVNRAQVGWEKTAEGYWFITEVTPTCPRLGMNWIGLTAAVKLLYLEEYAIVYWTHRNLTNFHIDVSTRCLVRTRYGRETLSASGADGLNVVSNYKAFSAVQYASEGGRAVEVVRNAA